MLKPFLEVLRHELGQWASSREAFEMNETWDRYLQSAFASFTDEEDEKFLFSLEPTN